MDIFAAFATDPKLEEEGRWVRIGGTEDKPTEILVARSGNDRYNRIMAQQYETYQHELNSKDKAATEARARDMLEHCMASAVLLGWKNVEFQGAPMEYSYANSRKLLAVKDFRALVAKEAEKFEAYKAVQLEDDAKN